MKSLRHRLVLRVGLAMGVLFLLSGIVIGEVLSEELDAQFEQRLDDRLDDLESRLRVAFERPALARATRLGLTADPSLSPEVPAPRRREARRALLDLADEHLTLHLDTPPSPGEASWCVTDERGRTVGQSRQGCAACRRAGEETRGRSEDEARRCKRRQLSAVPFEDPGWSESWRRITGAPATLDTTISVALPTAHMHETRQRFRRVFWLLGLILFLAVEAAVLWGVRSGLRPVAELGDAAAGIEASRLDVRLPEHGVPTELRDLVGGLNASLARLEASFARERRIAASLAHELRTPLAELRTATDLARRWPEDEEVRRNHLTLSHEATRHMERVVSAILKLARVQAGAETVRVEEVAVAPVLDRVRQLLEESARQAGHTLEVAVSGDLALRTDPEMLEVVLRTLLQNALVHAPAGSAIRVREAPEADGPGIVIANPAPELTQEQVERLAEPFWRADGARLGDSGGGLGLSIAEALAEAAGLRLTFTLAGGRLEVSVSGR